MSGVGGAWCVWNSRKNPQLPASSQHQRGPPGGTTSHLIRIKNVSGTSLGVQWLRLHTSAAGGAGSIRGRGTKILHALKHGQKKKVQWLWLTTDTSLERDLTAGCALGGASRAMRKGKEGEGTEPGLCDTGLFSAGLEAAETPIVLDWWPPWARLWATELLLSQGRCCLGAESPGRDLGGADGGSRRRDVGRGAHEGPRHPQPL